MQIFSFSVSIFLITQLNVGWISHVFRNKVFKIKQIIQSLRVSPHQTKILGAPMITGKNPSPDTD